MEQTSTERVLGLSVNADGDMLVVEDADNYYFPTQDHLRTERTEADEMYWRATQRVWEAERQMGRRPC